MTNDELSAVLDGLVPRGYIHDGRDQQMFGLGVEWSAAEVRRRCAWLVAAVRDANARSGAVFLPTAAQEAAWAALLQGKPANV